MAYAREHPFPGRSHPWTDPLSPQDFLNPRPDWAFQAAGPFAPRPEDFPFNDLGKQEYFRAVEATAHQQMAMQQQMMMQRDAEMRRQAAEEAALRRRNHLLLLRR